MKIQGFESGILITPEMEMATQNVITPEMQMETQNIIIDSESKVANRTIGESTPPTNYRLYMNITFKGKTSKTITQDIFKSMDQASEALNSVWDDISKEYKNVKRGALLTFEPKTQEDGINYVGQMSGSFTGGKFFIRIITTDSEPEEETITVQEIQGRFMELIVDGLGEFKFLFKENIPDNESQGRYLMEVLWNPPNYAIVDFIEGHYVDNIESTMESIKNDMSYYIDEARVSCECHIEDGTDDDGVYQDILDSWFTQEEEII